MTEKQYPELPEPDSYIFQHEETGLTQFVDAQQVEWGFEKNNPRWQKVGEAYTKSQVIEAIDADRAMRAVGAVPDGLPLVIAGAIYDFAGFLTTRPQVIPVGASAEASPIADLVKEWAAKRGLSLKDAAVLSWQELLTTPQEATPYVAGPNTRAKMEEWLTDGTLIDRVAGEMTRQEAEIMRLEKLVKERSAPSQDAELAIKQCLDMGETFRALRRVVNLLLESRGTLGPEDHELRERIDALLKADAARAQKEKK